MEEVGTKEKEWIERKGKEEDEGGKRLKKEEKGRRKGR